MTSVDLLRCLKKESLRATADLIMPTSPQKEDTEEIERPAEVYMMRLQDSSAAKKKVPYIIHQVITGKDIQPSRDRIDSTVSTRSIFSVYNHDEEEGSLMLLNLIERWRIHLLKQVVFDGRYELDLDAGIEIFIYPEDSRPYYMGEMFSTWKMPKINREVEW